MDQGVYAAVYARAQAHRDALMRNAELAPFFDGSVLPPVPGFGLPFDDRSVPLVTVALNASSAEFPRHLPGADDAATQGARQASYFADPLGWWSTAAAMLKAATAGRIAYGGQGPSAAHVDVTPIVTARGMDGAYDKSKHDTRGHVREWLMRSLTEVFVPLLEALVQRNQLKALLVFGFAPAFQGDEGGASGNATLRDAFWGGNARVNFVGDGGVRGKGAVPTIAWGVLSGSDVPASLHELRCFFVSRGPSGDWAGVEPLLDAATRLEPHVSDALRLPLRPPPTVFRVRRRGA